MIPSDLKIKRVLLKISGEAFKGNKDFGYDPASLKALVDDIASIIKSGIQVCVVVGAGNVCRGRDLKPLGISKVPSDTVGMLGTIMNGVVLRDALDRHGIQSKVYSAVHIPSFCHTYCHASAIKSMNKGCVNIFVAGMGNPFVTTDTVSAIRAIEMECDVMLKATQVDGVYSEDPKKNPAAVRYSTISYDKILSEGLQVVDLAAISIAKEHKLPIMICTGEQFTKVLNGSSGDFTLIR